MNETFGGAVCKVLESRCRRPVIDDFLDLQRLKSADRAATLTLLFGRDAAAAEYQALQPEHVAARLLAMAENLAKHRRVSISSTFVEGLLGLLNAVV